MQWMTDSGSRRLLPERVRVRTQQEEIEWECKLIPQFAPRKLAAQVQSHCKLYIGFFGTPAVGMRNNDKKNGKHFMTEPVEND